MSYNVDTYPKTVNLESSVPVNYQMKRVVTSKCPNGPTLKCLKKSYNIPIAGSGSGGQANHWGQLNGMTSNQTCVGPKFEITASNMKALGCITKYNGVSRCATSSSGTSGVCQVSPNATAKGYWVTDNGQNRGTIQNTEVVTRYGYCPNGSCQYFQARCKYGNNSGLMSFTAVCNTCNQ